jgi:hypothetical protein
MNQNSRQGNTPVAHATAAHSLGYPFPTRNEALNPLTQGARKRHRLRALDEYARILFVERQKHHFCAELKKLSKFWTFVFFPPLSKNTPHWL